jgi:hypothetical protein
MARMRDFYYKKRVKPYVSSASGEPIVGEVTFNIVGTKDDAGDDDFRDALHDLKLEVHFSLRTWDADKKEWRVEVTPKVKEALCEIFENAEGLFEEFERQLALDW